MRRILARLQSDVDRLGVRLALVMAVALLPLMLVSIVRSQSVVDEALARSQAALVGETLRAAQQEVIQIERARAVAQSLSRSVAFFLDNPELRHRLMQTKLLDTAVSFAGFYDTSGYVPCSSAPEPFSFGMTPQLANQVADPWPTVLVNEQAPASGTSVVYANHPVFDSQGDLLGFTAISMPHSQLQSAAANEHDAMFLTLNASGTVLTADGTLDEAQLLLPRLRSGDDIIH